MGLKTVFTDWFCWRMGVDGRGRGRGKKRESRGAGRRRRRGGGGLGFRREVKEMKR